MKKILFSLMAIALVVGLVGAGAFAQFNDTETSTGNTFTAGTLDLKFDSNPDGSVFNWVDDPDLPTYNSVYGALVNDLKPGDVANTIMGIKNAGTIDGVAYIEFANVVDLPGTTPEPEVIFNPDQGELGANVLITITYDGGKDPTSGTVNQVPLDSVGKVTLGDLGAGIDTDVTVVLEILSTVGNVIQDDNVTFDIVFGLDQK